MPRNKTVWTDAEDLTIVQLAKIHPTRMTIIAAAVKLLGRTYGACEVRYVRLYRLGRFVRPARQAKTSKEMGDLRTPEIRVPFGDPLLRRLVYFHSSDTIDRDVHVPDRITQFRP